MVEFLQFFELLVLPHGILVFKHASHSGDGFCLSSILCRLIVFIRLDQIGLSLLLLDPLLLHSVVVRGSLAERCYNKS